MEIGQRIDDGGAGPGVSQEDILKSLHGGLFMRVSIVLVK